MYKIQIKVFKFLLFPALCFFMTQKGLQAQELEESLTIADSLFNARQYTQALKIYDAIYETAEMVTPSMLLKMAYIHEGLNKVPDALYYLNLYYLETNDETTLEKMNRLATSNHLSGYDYGGFEMFSRYYQAFYSQIILAVSVITLLLFAFISYSKLVRKKTASGSAIAMILSAALLFYLINFGQTTHLGIIENSNCYLMSGPSSSSDVIDIVKAGHRVKIIDRKDVWLKIKWDGKTAYTKEKNIKPITLL